MQNNCDLLNTCMDIAVLVSDKRKNSCIFAREDYRYTCKRDYTWTSIGHTLFAAFCNRDNSLNNAEK